MAHTDPNNAIVVAEKVDEEVMRLADQNVGRAGADVASDLAVSLGANLGTGYSQPATIELWRRSSTVLLLIRTSASSSKTTAFHLAPSRNASLSCFSSFSTSVLSSPVVTLYKGRCALSATLSMDIELVPDRFILGRTGLPQQAFLQVQRHLG
jgi:hypothetical protein